MAQIDSEQPPELTLDAVAKLFASRSVRLRRIVRHLVRAPEASIEDACQVAWLRLLQHRADVTPERAWSWLVTTATHAALKQAVREQRQGSVEALAVPTAGPPSIGDDEGVDAEAQRREVLRALRDLPADQQRALWLRAFGLSYGELAAHEGCTPRVIERRLLRGRRTLRERGVAEAA